MTDLETVALVLVAVWLALLTLVVVLLVRQLGLIVARLEDDPSAFSLANDGPPIGDELPGEVATALPSVNGGPSYLMLMSATCGPCRRLATDLQDTLLGVPVTALVPGREELAASLIELLPAEIHVVRDPEASELAERLGIRSSPFGVALDGATVSGKSYLNRVADLMRLIHSQETAGPALEAAPMEVTHHGN
jgi:hypothetical protein